MYSVGSWNSYNCLEIMTLLLLEYCDTLNA